MIRASTLVLVPGRTVTWLAESRQSLDALELRRRLDRCRNVAAIAHDEVDVIPVAGRDERRRNTLADLERAVLGNEDDHRIRGDAVTVADVGSYREHPGVGQP